MATAKQNGTGVSGAMKPGTKDHTSAEIGTNYYVTCACGWTMYGKSQDSVMQMWRDHQRYEAGLVV